MQKLGWLAVGSLGLVALGCAGTVDDGEGEVGLASLRIEVTDAPEAPPSDQIAIVFATYWGQFKGFAPGATGDASADFQLQLDAAGPPSEFLGSYNGVEGALVANGSIYQVVPGAVEDDPMAVGALDLPLMVGQVSGAKLYYATAPLSGPPSLPDMASAGWHLFIDGAEVPLGTLLQVGPEIHDF